MERHDPTKVFANFENSERVGAGVEPGIAGLETLGREAARFIAPPLARRSGAVMNLLYSCAGLGVGILVGMTGVGGGSLMTPILILLFGLHPVTAVGTDLLFAAVTKSVGTGVHGLSGTVNWRITFLLAVGSVPTTIL